MNIEQSYSALQTSPRLSFSNSISPFYFLSPFEKFGSGIRFLSTPLPKIMKQKINKQEINSKPHEHMLILSRPHTHPMPTSRTKFKLKFNKSIFFGPGFGSNGFPNSDILGFCYRWRM